MNNEWEKYRSLVIAIIAQAARDAKRKDCTGEEAREWLLREGVDWVEIAGVAIWPRRITNYERKSDTETA